MTSTGAFRSATLLKRQLRNPWLKMASPTTPNVRLALNNVESGRSNRFSQAGLASAH
jgi:hypothetical protein